MTHHPRPESVLKVYAMAPLMPWWMFVKQCERAKVYEARKAAEYAMTYNGVRETAKRETAAKNRGAVLKALAKGPLTVDELATATDTNKTELKTCLAGMLQDDVLRRHKAGRTSAFAYRINQTGG